MLQAFENSLIFHPVRASVDWIEPAAHHLVVEAVELTSADGTRLHAWWCPVPNRPEQPEAGAFLYCHGNAGNLSHRAPQIPCCLDSLHVPVLIFDYPGFGRSEGKPSESACYAAAEAAYEWITRRKGVPPQKVLIYGGSLGGAVAVDLASRHTHRALLLANTFSSILDVGQMIYPWLPVRWVMHNRFDSLAKISRCRQPIFIAHGDSDSVIPFALGQRLFAAAHEPKRFYPMLGCDHHDAFRTDFFMAFKAFLEEVEAKSRSVQPATAPTI